MSVFCTNCGSPMDDDARFCPVCGAEMIPESAEPDAQGAVNQGNPAFDGSGTGNVNSGSYGNGGWNGSGSQGSGSYGSSSGNTGGNGTGYYSGSNMGQNSFQRPQGGAYSGGSYSGGSYSGGNVPSGGGGGFPKIIFLFIGIAVIVVAIIVAVFVFKGSSKDKSKDTDKKTEARVETEAKKESRGKKEKEETVEETEAPKATGDLAKLKIPDGAVVKTDAMLWDFIGEYKGEIQMTSMDGYEKMDGITKEALKEIDNMLKAPVECDLEIEEDGQWTISWPMMGRKSSFESDEYDDPKEFTPEEINAMLITMPQDGIYHARIDKESEIDKGSTGQMKMDHIGAYCTDGDDKLIAGYFSMEMIANGMDVVMEGDFVVHKTSEEFAKEEREVIDSMSGKKESEADEDRKKYEDSEDDSEDDEEIEETRSKKSEASSKKKIKEETESETKVEVPTVSGGKWKQVGSEWMYEKDKKLVKNSWVLHKNVYYYVDENGFMLTDGYTPDGYYVGKDGAWDQKKSKFDKAESSSGEELSESEQREIAEDLSTTDNAHALEFDWFYDYVLNGGHDNGRVITDKKLARRITSEQLALNGGWKAFMFTKDGDYGSDGERYFNATVDTKGNKFNITLNWKYFLDPGSKKTVTEKGSTSFKGTYDDLEGTAVCRSDDAMIEFDEFYISTDGLTEYAVGTYHWISGEIDQIALVRGVV